MFAFQFENFQWVMETTCGKFGVGKLLQINLLKRWNHLRQLLKLSKSCKIFLATRGKSDTIYKTQRIRMRPEWCADMGIQIGTRLV